jgi:branched-chain amino acid transport system substrate-binding protein
MKPSFFLPALALLPLALAAAPARADIPIATVGPMTGQYAIFGDQMKRGATLAIDDINAKGGLLGQKLTLAVGDDACDPKQAVSVANDMAHRKVVFVDGHYCSGSSIPASSVYNDNGILQITPASTNPALTEEAAKKGWNNVFRTCGRDDKQGVTAGNFIAATFPGKRIAILHDKSAYGKGLADETKRQLNSKGITEAMYESYTAGDKDFTALVTRLKQAKIELVYIGGYHTDVGLIVRQARDQGFGAQFMSGDANATDELASIAGPASEGLLFTFAPDPRKNPAATEVVAEFKKQGFDPEGYTLYTYAAIQVWAAAVTEAGTTDLDKVVKVLHSRPFDTVVGKLQFDAKGDVLDPKYVVYVWHDGHYGELAR